MNRHPLRPPPEDQCPSVEVRVVGFSVQEKKLQALLVLKNSSDENSPWAIPGDLVQDCSSLEYAASECLSEYINQQSYLEQLYTYGSSERAAISIVYFALVPQAAILPPQTGKPSEAKWFPVGSVPSLVAGHDEILQYALRRLRYKLEYSAVGFELLPENFSLSELQATYEIILGEVLDKRNFRRRILKAGIIEPTPHHRLGEGRPARLFRYRPDAVAEVKTRRLFP
ncbi:MAG: NUDIX hydrolase [Anaerolineaceae bacterium]|nr:NUDIX hydrolase [Anaerolineaceae bacterium]